MHKMVKFPLGGIMLLRESLEEIDDFRVKRCRKFELADIFLLVLFGLLSGIKDIEHIAEWAEKSKCKTQRTKGGMRACALRWRFMGFEKFISPSNPFIRRRQDFENFWLISAIIFRIGSLVSSGIFSRETMVLENL